MTVHQARIIALSAVLIGISALAPSTRLHAQQPLDGLRVLAEQGDVGAQFILGVMCANGQGVSQDSAEAVRWYRLAADQGHALAQYTWGPSMRVASASRRTTPRLFCGTGSRPTRETRGRRADSGSCIAMAEVFPRTPPRQSGGFGSRPTMGSASAPYAVCRSGRQRREDRENLSVGRGKSAAPGGRTSVKGEGVSEPSYFSAPTGAGSR